MKNIPNSPQSGDSTSGIFPSYVRLPKAGEKDPVTGLSRSTLFDLISGPSPKVRSKMLKQPGARRGIRLVLVSSLLAYIDSLPDAVVSVDEKGGSNV